MSEFFVQVSLYNRGKYWIPSKLVMPLFDKSTTDILLRIVGVSVVEPLPTVEIAHARNTGSGKVVASTGTSSEAEYSTGYVAAFVSRSEAVVGRENDPLRGTGVAVLSSDPTGSGGSSETLTGGVSGVGVALGSIGGSLTLLTWVGVSDFGWSAVADARGAELQNREVAREIERSAARTKRVLPRQIAGGGDFAHCLGHR